MPSLGADMESGKLVEWLVKVGDPVHRGDIVAVVETPKSTVEVECFDTGTVEELLVEEGETVPVGWALARLGDRAQALPAVPEPAVAQPVPPTPALPAPTPPRPTAPGLSPVLRHRARELGVDPTTIRGTGRDGAVTRHDVEQAAAGAVAAAAAPPAAAPVPLVAAAAGTAAPAVAVPPAPTAPGPSQRLRVTPLARRLAAEEGIDLAAVIGSGVGGAIRADDVRRATRHTTPSVPAVPVAPVAAEPTTTPEPTTAATAATPMSDMRRSIAALMTVSNREIPHYHLTLTVDLHRSITWMKERNRELEMAERLVPAALLLAATARAARAVPELNGHWVDGGFRPAPEVDLGLILSLRTGGLLVPAIAGADNLTVDETMVRIRELTRRARAGRLRGSDLVQPSITVSNLGDQGVDSVLGVIDPPQVALVGFGAVSERPWAVDGMLGVRPLVTVSLAGDHRATDGATGSRLLKTIDRLLQTPEEL